MRATLILAVGAAVIGQLISACANPPQHEATSASPVGAKSSQLGPQSGKAVEHRRGVTPELRTEPTRASESIYSRDITRARTSENLTNADIA